jgi:Tryptophan-associated transmembrane protein (Trp_oprn_chp)
VRPLGRLLAIAGAIGVLVSVLLPWVTVSGTPLDVNLGLLSVDVTPGGRTVAGTGTSIWPVLFGVGLLAAVLALVPRTGRVLVVLGGLVAIAGAGLTYYVANIIQFKTDQHGAIVRLLARATLTSSIGPGPPLLLASGLVILVGGMAASTRRSPEGRSSG